MPSFYGRFADRTMFGRSGSRRSAPDPMNLARLLLFAAVLFSLPLFGMPGAGTAKRTNVLRYHYLPDDSFCSESGGKANFALYNTIPPIINGTVAVGNQVSSFPGQWNSDPGAFVTFSTQWQRAMDATGTNTLPVAIGTAYDLTMADAGAFIRIVVTASDGSSSATASSPWQAVTAGTTTVSSITRADASPTNATTVNFTITFATAVTGVDAGDFTAFISGVSATISTPTTVDNIVWNVPVNVTSGTIGEVRLDFNGTTGSVVPETPAFNGGQSYTIDYVPPAVPDTPDLAVGSDSGGSGNDKITNVNKPTFTGTGPADVTIRIYEGANLIGEGLSDWFGNYSITTTNDITTGTLTITARAVDELGNESEASGAVTITVDRTAPEVASVIEPAAKTYKGNDVITFRVQLTKPVDLFGSAYLAFDMNSGSGKRALLNTTLTTNTELVFDYTVNQGDEDDDGISVNATSALGMALGDMRDVAGNSLVRTLNGLGDLSGVLVDAVAPVVTSVTTTSQDGTYTAGANIFIDVNFSEDITVTGWPTLMLNFGSAQATYVSVWENRLTFSYTIQSGDEVGELDYNGNGLTLFSATIRDAAGNEASGMLPAPGSPGSLAGSSNIKIDAVAPATPASFLVEAGNGENVLSWDANSESDLAGYEIFRGASPSIMTPLPAMVVGSTSYVDMGLINGTTYYYKIRAVDNAGNKSAWPSTGQGIPVQSQTITFADFATNIKYGDADIDPGATATSGEPVTYESDDETVASIVNGKVHILKVGTVTITAKQAGNSGTLAAPDVSKSLTIHKADLIITANNAIKTYGQTLSDGSGSSAFTGNGLQNNETIGAVTVAYGTGASDDATVGRYTDAVTVSAATGGSFDESNYDITYAKGDIVVSSASLTITANDVTTTYGQTLSEGSGSTAFTSNGLQRNETIGSVTIAYGTAAAGTHTDAVTVSAATGGSFTASNYDITYVKGDMVISPASLTITANDATKTYGQTLSNATGYTAFANTALQNNETIGSVTVAYGNGANATDNVGNYTDGVTVSAATGGTFDASNYNITYVKGDITINKASLTVTADDVTKHYGDELQTDFSTAFTSTGLQNNEDMGFLMIDYGAAAAGNTVVGTYSNEVTATYTGGSFNDQNYNITYNKGAIIVSPAPLTITANNASKTYGQTLNGETGSTSFTSNGLKNGETIGSVTVAYGNSANATAAAGTHTGEVTPGAATGGTFDASNYDITYAKGNVVIGAAPLRIVAYSGHKTYGQTLSNVAASTDFISNGLLNNETIGSVTVTYGAASASNAGVGFYQNQTIVSAATGGTFTPSNYNIDYGNTTLVVEEAQLTITAKDVTKPYGKTLQDGVVADAVTGSGLQNGESIDNVTLVYGNAKDGTTLLGTYNDEVTVTGATGTFSPRNYIITYQKGDIIVSPAPLTITANNATKTYGQTLNDATGSTAFTSNGLQNGETIGSVTVAYGNSANATAAAGTHTGEVIPGAATGGTFTASNYDITYAKGNVVIAAAPLRVVASSGYKTYGQTLSDNAASTAFISNGLQNNETIGSVTITYGAAAASNTPIGHYSNQVIVSAATGGTFTLSNYNITYVNTDIIVDVARVTITAKDVTKPYGQTLQDGEAANAFTSSGLQNGETIDNVTLVYGNAKDGTTPVGSYSDEVTVTDATGTFSPRNYYFTYIKGDIIVSPAPLTIKANDVAKPYGQALSGGGSTAFTATGLENDETIGSVSVAYGNGAAANATGGTYTGQVTASAATGGTFTAGNYNITYTAGDIIVGKTGLTPTVLAVTKVYDGTTTAAVTFNAFTTADGLETAGDEVTISYTSAAYDNKDAGTGKRITFTGLTLGGADAGKYTLYPGTITGAITPKTVTAGITGTISKVYDATTTATLSGANYTLAGKVGTDDISLNNPNTATYDTRFAGTGKIVQVTGLSISGADAANYNLASTTVSGAIGTVTKKDITVSLNAAPVITKVYDGTTTATLAPANLTLNGVETADAVTVSGTTTTTYDNKNAGAAKVVTATGFTLAGSEMGNYQLTTSSATTTGVVTQKALTITADDKVKSEGMALPAFTASYSGFITGENSSVLTAQPVLSTTATASSPEGEYPISISGALAQNYDIAYVPGVLTVGAGYPTNITLIAQSVFENQSVGTPAGTFSSTSEDPAAAFSYSLVTGNGSTDNALFSIAGNQLRTAAVLDYEQKAVYNIRVRSTTQYGLSLDKEFTVTIGNVNEQPTLNTIADQTICFTTTQQTVALSGITAGPDAGQTVSLSVSSGNSALFGNLSVTAPQNGNAQVRYTLAAGASGSATVTVTVTDNGGTANGGVDNFTRSFTVTANAFPELSIVSSEGNAISKGATTILTAAGGVSYQWQSANGIVDGQNTAALTVRPAETTTYRVTASNVAGCQQMKEFTLEVKNDQQMVSGTNVLTPNGDGKNDYLIIRNLDMFPGNELKIFDPAGRLIYRKMNYDNRWNGTLNGVPLAEGTYYYIITFGTGAAARKGFISIIRN